MMFTYYLLTRVLDALYHHMIHKKTIISKRIPLDYVILFSIGVSFIGYAFSVEPDIMNKSMKKFYYGLINAT